MTDVEAKIVIARDNLQRLERAITVCWRYQLGLGDRPRPEVQSADFTRPSPALYVGCGHADCRNGDMPENGYGHTLQCRYTQALQQIARAHWAMSYAGAVSHWVTDLHERPTAVAPTIPEHLAVVVTRHLDALLRRAYGEVRGGLLAPPEANAVLEACEYAVDAYNRLPESIRTWGPPMKPVECRNPRGRNGCFELPIYNVEHRLCKSCYEHEAYLLKRAKMSAA